VNERGKYDNRRKIRAYARKLERIYVGERRGAELMVLATFLWQEMPLG
jgi:hypothetical protein